MMNSYSEQKSEVPGDGKERSGWLHCCSSWRMREYEQGPCPRLPSNLKTWRHFLACFSKARSKCDLIRTGVSLQVQFYPFRV